MSELKNCPFCNCSMHINSNRDWHRLCGPHADDCFWDHNEEIFDVPATETGLAWLIQVWNARTQPAEAVAKNSDYNTGNRDLDTLLGLTVDIYEGKANQDTAIWWMALVSEIVDKLASPEAALPEPVGQCLMVHPDGSFNLHWYKTPNRGDMLYTSPDASRVPLTDEQIMQCVDVGWINPFGGIYSTRIIDFAHAVLAATTPSSAVSNSAVNQSLTAQGDSDA